MGQIKRGIVTDGRGSQVRVQFADGMISPWLDVGQQGTIGKLSYRRFQRGELVLCYLEEKAQTGVAVCAIYNDEDRPPNDGDDVIHEIAPDGAEFLWEPGRMVLRTAGGAEIRLEGDRVRIIGNLNIEGAKVTHNATNIGDRHTHAHGDPAGKTGPPE